MSDQVLLWVITVLMFAAAGMRLALDRKRGISRSILWRVQVFVFPAALLICAVLFQMGCRRQIIPVVFIGIVEELVFGRMRSRQDRENLAASIHKNQGTGPEE